MALFTARRIFVAAAIGQVRTLRDCTIRVPSWDSLIIYDNPKSVFQFRRSRGSSINDDILIPLIHSLTQLGDFQVGSVQDSRQIVSGLWQRPSLRGMSGVARLFVAQHIWKLSREEPKPEG